MFVSAQDEVRMRDYQKKGFLTEDYRLFHLRSDGGTKPEFHYHEFYKILLLVSGSGAYTVEGQRYALQPGDVVLIGSRSVHRPDFPPGTVYERIILYISPEFLRRNERSSLPWRHPWSGSWRGRSTAGNSSVRRRSCGCWSGSAGASGAATVPSPGPPHRPTSGSRPSCDIWTGI